MTGTTGHFSYQPTISPLKAWVRKKWQSTKKTFSGRLSLTRTTHSVRSLFIKIKFQWNKIVLRQSPTEQFYHSLAQKDASALKWMAQQPCYERLKDEAWKKLHEQHQKMTSYTNEKSPVSPELNNEKLTSAIQEKIACFTDGGRRFDVVLQLSLLWLCWSKKKFKDKKTEDTFLPILSAECLYPDENSKLRINVKLELSDEEQGKQNEYLKLYQEECEKRKLTAEATLDQEKEPLNKKETLQKNNEIIKVWLGYEELKKKITKKERWHRKEIIDLIKSCIYEQGIPEEISKKLHQKLLARFENLEQFYSKNFIKAIDDFISHNQQDVASLLSDKDFIDLEKDPQTPLKELFFV